MSRFGNASAVDIDKNIDNLTPTNTKKSKMSVWRQFQEFCAERNHLLERGTSVEKIAFILKDWASNMRKKDGSFYKESVVKTMWNVTAKLVQEKYCEDFGIVIDPFNDVRFKSARSARDATRKILQMNPEKRKESSSAFTHKELLQILKLYDENEPEGLQKKFFHLISYELAFRGGEAVNCLTDFFQEEKFHDGTSTNRIEYNPVFSKTCQGGGRRLADSKWLIRNISNEDICPVR